MPTFDDPVLDADEVREALRGLAHATRRIEDPTAVYAVLGAISSALASLTQALHQLGGFHDAPVTSTARVAGDPHAGRAASYRVSWELHRAAEMVHQVAEVVDRAHEVEATIAYDVHDSPVAPAPAPVPAPRPVRDDGLSL
ncbi:hypothetical protein [Nocardioides sp. W7]|uniref:hypothetical protein n=1 Tax=Nocardioides sp. W7 TaxID=2931390 RepID=UPI001FD27665|nr:hypothetical protein [Nocardioides sp. W7]